MQRVVPVSTLDVVQKYWAIILFCGSVIAQWVRTELKVSALEECIDEITDQSDKLELRIIAAEKAQDTFRETVQVTLAQISTNLDYIKEFIKEIKNK